jgi:type IV pilus assembly protein PilY1
MVIQSIKIAVRLQCWLLGCLMMPLNSWADIPDIKIATTPLYACSTTTSNTLMPGLLHALSNMAVSTTELTDQPVFVYQSGFYASGWKGSLRKIPFILDANGMPNLSKTADWDAADILTGIGSSQAPVSSMEKRKVYTARAQATNGLTAVEFNWANLTSAQQSFLNSSLPDSVNDGLGEKRLDYLRGGRLFEQNRQGGMFRTRGNILGDIVNSNLVYIGAPVPGIRGNGYDQFYQSNKLRNRVIYAGANDGMLHAFDADSGIELFSYIPSSLFPALSQLTRPDYSHHPYVDGMIAVSDARIADTWKTILVSGMGGGAQGLFALDVTTPSSFGSGIGLLWEFTDSDDSEMGNLMGMPAIAKFRTGTANGKPVHQYFAVISSGLNNYKDDGIGKFNSSGAGVLFLLSLDKLPSEKWELNKNYFKFKTPIKDVTNPNGLSTPALVVGVDGAVRYAYAGDLQGNLWRFDFSGELPWLQAQNIDTPLFTAKDNAGNVQPVTTQPKVVFAPGGGYLVLFGTGKLIEEADKTPTSFRTQSFYGIHDTTTSQDKPISRNQLALRTLVKGSDGALLVKGDPFTYGTAEGGKRGWYFDFMDSDKTGERSVTNPVTAFGNLFFNTLILDNTLCEKSGGRSYALNALSGLTLNEESTGNLSQIGLLGSPIVFRSEIKQMASIPTGKAPAQKKYAVFNFGTGGAKGSVAPFKNGTNEIDMAGVMTKRLSWREIVNWQELRNAAASR